MACSGNRNYQNGKIYCIRNSVDDEIYIGSSCQPLSKRMVWHREATRKDKKKNYKVYQKMITLGVEKFYIELIEECPCETVEQLRKREGEIIREMKPALNTRIEGRSDKEWRNDNKEKLKEDKKTYALNNKEHIMKKAQEYREKNRETINEKQRQRHSENKDQINDRRRATYPERREKKLDACKKYNEEHKDEIKQKRSVKVACECGGKYQLFHKSQHFRTQKHQNFINNQ